ncbi:hypothetical protein N0V88_002601 [Collariella sp. IMI 366227]|nr:hypothetical protein N0V88_002601 [Collariella sp. IMI 366227]
MATNSLHLNQIDFRGDLKLRVGTELRGEDTKPMCFLVCSKTLARVSPVFDRMIYGSFSEAKPSDGKDWVVNLPADKPSAMELFLTIAHGHLHKAPRALSTQELYDLTALTDFYNSTHILGPWIYPWIRTLHDATSGPEVDTVPKILGIGWVLGHQQMFEATVRRITMEGPGSMFVEGSVLQQLQIPSDIIGQPVKGEDDHTKCNPRDYLIEQMQEILAKMESPLTEADREQLDTHSKRLQLP